MYSIFLFYKKDRYKIERATKRVPFGPTSLVPKVLALDELRFLDLQLLSADRDNALFHT